MKIIVDEKNKAVIAMGSVFGKRIKGVAVAHEGDVFDPEFGTDLAVRKYKTNKYWAKAMTYEKMIRWHKRMIEDHKKEIAQLERFYDYNYDKSIEVDSNTLLMLEEKFKN